jgi:hypothetical protein
VVAVVQPDAEHLARCGGRRAEGGRPDRHAAFFPAGTGRPAGEGVPVLVDGLRLGAEPAVADLLDVVGKLAAGRAGDDDEAALVVGDAHV